MERTEYEVRCFSFIERHLDYHLPHGWEPFQVVDANGSVNIWARRKRR